MSEVDDLTYQMPPAPPPTRGDVDAVPTDRLVEGRGDCRLYLQRWDGRHRIWRWANYAPRIRDFSTLWIHAVLSGSAAGYHRWVWVDGWTRRGDTGRWDALIDYGRSTPPEWCGPVA